MLALLHPLFLSRIQWSKVWKVKRTSNRNTRRAIWSSLPFHQETELLRFRLNLLLKVMGTKVCWWPLLKFQTHLKDLPSFLHSQLYPFRLFVLYKFLQWSFWWIQVLWLWSHKTHQVCQTLLSNTFHKALPYPQFSLS